jgi:hypothetical protein
MFGFILETGELVDPEGFDPNQGMMSLPSSL